MAADQKTRLNKPWLLKMVIGGGVLIFFGFYGLYDATISYPNRGQEVADFRKYQYLETAKTEHRLDRRGVTVDDPAAELARLNKLEPARREPLDAPRQDWLEALNIVRRLTPEHTKIDNPEAEHKRLKDYWTQGKNGGPIPSPKPLHWYDLPVQWVYVVLGFGGGFWMILHFIGVARLSYRWEPETQTLHLPGDRTLTPADIEEFDKRKWDKFLIFLKIKPTHPTLGGREIKLDLYRYTPLEAWVLEMEKTAFPERAQDSGIAPAAETPDTPPT